MRLSESGGSGQGPLSISLEPLPLSLRSQMFTDSPWLWGSLSLLFSHRTSTCSLSFLPQYQLKYCHPQKCTFLILRFLMMLLLFLLGGYRINPRQTLWGKKMGTIRKETFLFSLSSCSPYQGCCSAAIARPVLVLPPTAPPPPHRPQPA